nr:DUF4430 domain-containing protein [Paenibacillus sp. Marseille-Q4541]
MYKGTEAEPGKVARNSDNITQEVQPSSTVQNTDEISEEESSNSSLPASSGQEDGASNIPAVAPDETEVSELVSSQEDTEQDTRTEQESSKDKQSDSASTSESDPEKTTAEKGSSSGKEPSSLASGKESSKDNASVKPGKTDEVKSDTSTNKTPNKNTGTSTTSSAEAPKDKPKEEPVEETPKSNVITITIIGSPNEGTMMETVTVEIGEMKTVLDSLKNVTRSSKMQMEYSGTGATAYVKGINNLYEFDNGAGSGWMYSVNGKFPNRSAGVWPLQPGDDIRWLYTEDLGKDVGAGVDDGLWDGKS